MAYDPAVALQVKSPEMDITKPLTAYANLQMAESHSQLYKQQAELQRMKIAALGEYGEAIKSGDHGKIMAAINKVGTADPEAANNILKLHQGTKQATAQREFKAGGDPTAVREFPEIFHTVTNTLATQNEADRKKTYFNHDIMGRVGEAYLNAAPDAKLGVWNSGVDELLQNKIITPETHAQLYGRPNDMFAAKARAMAQASIEHRKATGEIAENEAARTNPYAIERAWNKPEVVPPTGSVVNPQALPGAPPRPGMPMNLQPGMPQGAPVVPTPRPDPRTQSSTLGLPPGEQPLNPIASTPPSPTTPPGTSPEVTTNTGEPGAQPGLPPVRQAPQARAGKIEAEIPHVPIGPQNNARLPGVLHSGTPPEVIAAKEMATKHMNDHIIPEAASAARAKGEIGTIINLLKSPNLPTGRFAGIQETVAGIIYGVTKDMALTNQMTGMNLKEAEMMNKSSTRLGFNMAREQGAREAVQVIQMALSANPNLLMSKEGNTTIANILDQGAQWAIDKGEYAQAYLQKNGHLVGFDAWWNHNHPIQEYTSKASPYVMPENPAELKNGVTYNIPKRKDDGTPLIDKNTKMPTTQKGIWRADHNGFEPVQ